MKDTEPDHMCASMKNSKGPWEQTMCYILSDFSNSSRLIWKPVFSSR